MVSNTSSRSSMTAGPGISSAIVVKPRMSVYHSMALIVSTEPRSTAPSALAGPLHGRDTLRGAPAAIACPA